MHDVPVLTLYVLSICKYSWCTVSCKVLHLLCHFINHKLLHTEVLQLTAPHLNIAPHLRPVVVNDLHLHLGGGHSMSDPGCGCSTFAFCGD